jgi:hypothetical protein
VCVITSLKKLWLEDEFEDVDNRPGVAGQRPESKCGVHSAVAFEAAYGFEYHLARGTGMTPSPSFLFASRV